MQEGGLLESEYSITGMFTLRLIRPLKTSKKTVKETAGGIILNLIHDNLKVTAIEMAKVTGLSRRGRNQLGELKQTGKILRICSTKASSWIGQ
ncbi:MAG: hypothetical protein LCH37_15205 [Bacteroidetes bacterium]|nr:hypothetical protein [Bacteroidota bacterium]